MIAKRTFFEADHPSSSTSCFPAFLPGGKNQIESDALGGPFFRPPVERNPRSDWQQGQNC